MRASFAGRFISCASSWSVAIREPTIHPTGRNRPHFLPTEAFFADRAAPSEELAFLPAVLFKRRAGPYYYRTCTVLAIIPTLRWSGHVHLTDGLGATAARRPGLRIRGCYTPLSFYGQTPWQHRTHWPTRRRQTGGQHVQTTPRRISVKHAV